MAEQMKAFVMKKIGEVGWITTDLNAGRQMQL